ncbi:MAG: nitrogenase-associated protein [Cyanomargarita calcarea GSE-NOS-MK-12-04C]|jgi:nitrogenase-associated protein|uniref:Nitrogenase-associated protein n=1 Tax=Cyanomargarita calcarea GSE-NOS-MK-12-04C TaxID=2839659 RepID=A0A951QI22_9CYAN|nr:nitrogenase-associated protein [Cyanomargarita calcarea GSE-NOS-MK-12-04C]
MATVIFYEKPGCKNNTKQKTLLTAAGHEVVAYNLLTEAWTVERLRSFFGDRPLVEWFNRAAPRVKSGEVIPENIDDAQTALMMMLKDPLLIRRPLIQVGDRREVGFDVEKIDAWIGLKAEDESQREISESLMKEDLQGCSHKHEHNHKQGKCKH